MASLKTLRNRIKSVKSTQKITKAMKMVSASKLNRAKESAIFSEKFRSQVSSIALNAKNNVDHSEISNLSKSLFYEYDEYKKNILIIFSSDKGLCGPYNGNVFKMLRKTLSAFPNRKVILIGSKLEDQLIKLTNIDLVIKASEPLENIVRSIKDIILSSLQEEPQTRVVMFYTKFKNVLTQTTCQKNLIPLSFEELDESESDNIEFEGENLIDKIVELYLDSSISAALFESKASEEASRMNAMDNATKNASELITDLSLVMNRTRQAQITSELIEVISGAEAL
jgi:F-type H+-transporting ATPase subunit gamma